MLIQRSGCNIWQSAEPSQPTVLLKCSSCIEMSDLWILWTAAGCGWCVYIPATLPPTAVSAQQRLSGHYTTPPSSGGFSSSVCMCLTSERQEENDLIQLSYNLWHGGNQMNEEINWSNYRQDTNTARQKWKSHLGWLLLSGHGRDLISFLYSRRNIIWHLTQQSNVGAPQAPSVDGVA